MSNQLITRVYGLKTKDPTLKSILISLADQADDTGFCFPSIGHIKQRTEWSERTIQNKLDKAESIGIIKRRFRKDRSTQYLFNIELLPLSEPKRRPKETGPWEEYADDVLTGAADTEDLFMTGAADTMTGAADTMTGESGTMTPAGAAPITLIEPSLEPSLESSQLLKQRKADQIMIAAQRYFASCYAQLSKNHDRIPASKLKKAEWAKIASRISDRIKEWKDETEKSNQTMEARAAMLEHWISELFNYIDASNFLTGNTTDWSVSLGWITGPMNMQKLLGKEYDQSRGKARAGKRDHVEAGRSAAESIANNRERRKGRK